MFGGLEVKGSSKDGKDEKQPTAAASAFSFMGGSTPAPEPAAAEAPASSGFTFMGNGAATESAKAPEQSSGFSFMGGGAAPAPAPVPPPETSASTGSGFGFLQTPVPPAPEPEMTAPSSSFSFMASASGPPPEAEKSGTGLGPTPPPPPHKQSSPALFSSSAPVGSGIKFGGASVATKKPIKKRSRATKVGAARTAELPAPMTTAAPPRPSYSPETTAAPSRPSYGVTSSSTSSPPRPPNYSNLSPKPTESEKAVASVADTKEAAQEAMQRAEEFLAQKMQQQEPAAYVEDYGASTPTRMAGTVWAKSPEDDDDYAAAKAAAEEAQAQLASGRRNQQQDGLMGRLFTRKTPWGGSGSASINSSSQHSLPTVSANETPAERMQREQDEIKRAVAERQLAMNQDAAPAEDDAPLTVEIDKPVETKAAPSPSSWGGASIPRTSSWTRPSLVTTSPPTPPPPPKTPAEKLDDLLQQFEEKVQKAMARVAQMRDHHKGLLDERLLSLAKERLATQSMAAAEAQQMQAAEAEDYDLADRLGGVIDGYAREKHELSTILDNIGRALAELDSQKAQVVGEVALCFQRVKEELSEFQEDQESNDKKDDTESMAKFASIAKQLSSEQSRLSSDDKHLQRDEKLVQEERKDLEMSISEQTADLEKQRDKARANLVTIEEEIEVLRRQLEAKEATANGLRAEVEGHETDINRIRDKFARQLMRVEKKEASVKENRYEWEKEKISHDTAKLSHEKEVEAHHKALVAHDALMEKLKKEIALADAFQVIVATEVVFEKTADQDLESDGDFAQLQADVVKCEAAVSEGKQILKAADAALNELKEERDALMKQIPILEERKTAAAARRDFKAAGKASKQIKDATARLKECQEELSGEASERKDAAVEELVKLEEDLKEKQAVLNEQEKEAGKHAMEKVAAKIRRLAETKSTVCDGSMGASGIQAVGAFVLNGQIEALMREGSAYGEKFGGWDAIAEELKEAGVLGTDSNAKSATASDASPGGRPADEVDPEVIARFRAVTRRLQEAEEAIDAAVAREDFEAAEKLNDELEEIKVEWEAIDLTVAEIKIFESGDELEETGEKVTNEDQPADASVESTGDKSDNDGEASHESETHEDGNGGESGYSSEEGTELIDDSEHESEVPDAAEGEEPGGGEVNGDEASGEDEAKNGADSADEAEKDEEEPVENAAVEKDDKEPTENDAPEEDDKEPVENDAPEEDDEQPVENGTTATEETNKAPTTNGSEAETPVEENGH